MIFSHFVRASLSSIFRRFSISLLSFRLRSKGLSTSLLVAEPQALKLPADFNPLASPRGLEQISQTTLADEFSYVQAGHCHVFTKKGVKLH